jgi:acyl carrier protein
MDDLRTRLVGCFQTVFPDLPAAKIEAAEQDSVTAWDSVANITLINVIEDEFRIQFDLERLAEFNSFHTIEAFVQENLKTA